MAYVPYDPANPWIQYTGVPMEIDHPTPVARVPTPVTTTQPTLRPIGMQAALQPIRQAPLFPGFAQPTAAQVAQIPLTPKPINQAPLFPGFAIPTTARAASPARPKLAYKPTARFASPVRAPQFGGFGVTPQAPIEPVRQTTNSYQTYLEERLRDNIPVPHGEPIDLKLLLPIKDVGSASYTKDELKRILDRLNQHYVSRDSRPDLVEMIANVLRSEGSITKDEKNFVINFSKPSR